MTAKKYYVTSNQAGTIMPLTTFFLRGMLCIFIDSPAENISSECPLLFQYYMPPLNTIFSLIIFGTISNFEYQQNVQ